MKYADIEYTSTGGTTYNVPFTYIDASYVKVYLDGIETTAFTWGSPTSIVLDVAPAVDVIVRIKRVSNPTSRLVDYADGSGLTESDLDLDSTHSFDLIQETKDEEESNRIVLQTQIDDILLVDTAQQAQIDAQAIVDANLQTQLDAQALVDADLQAQITSNDADIAALVAQELIDAAAIASNDADIAALVATDISLQNQISTLAATDGNITFYSTVDLNNWLTSPTRYAGQIVSLSEAGRVTVYKLNATLDAWLQIDREFVAWVTGKSYYIDDPIYDPSTFKIYVCTVDHVASPLFVTDIANWQELSSDTVTALGISYDNTTSGLVATTVQAAIDENDAAIDSLNDANTGAPRMIGGLIQAANLPSFVNDVLEYANFAALPVTGELGKIYITLDDNLTYRWSGTVYVQLTGGGGLDQWISGTSYAATDVVWVDADKKIYVCITPNADVTFTPSNWSELSIATFLTTYFDSSNEINGPVTHIDTLQKVISHIASATISDGCDITDNTDGSVSIALGAMTIRDAVTAHSNLLHANIGASGVLALTDNSINYLYVDYNLGTPVWTVSTTATYNNQDKVLGYIVTRVGTKLYIIDSRDAGNDIATKANQLFIDFNRFNHKQGGTALGFSTLALTVTAGKFYFGVNPITHLAFDTSIAGTANENVFMYHYGTTRVANSKNIDAVNYDNAGVLTALGANKFKVDYVYMVNDSPSSLHTKYGTVEYASQAQAELAPLPSSLPVEIAEGGVVIGRVIVKQGVGIVAVQSAFSQVFQASSVVAHNDTTGIQGGIADEYYHLSQAQHDHLVTVEKERKVVYQENFRVNLPTTLFTATPTVLTLADYVADPLEGSTSLRVTQASATAASVWYLSGTGIPVTRQMRISSFVGFECSTGFNGVLGDQVFRAEFYNGTDWTTLTPQEFDIRNGDNYNTFLISIPATATHIRYGGRVVTANDAHILDIDDIALVVNPNPVAEYVESEKGDKIIGTLTGDVTGVLDTSTLANLVDYNSTTGVYTTKSRCKIAAHAYGYAVTTTRAFVSVLSGDGASVYSRNTNDTAANNMPASTTYVKEVEAGFSFKFNFTAIEAGRVDITATRVNSGLVFEGAMSEADWTAGEAVTIGATTTPPTTGTLVSNLIRYRRDGKNADIDINLLQSTAGASGGSGDYLFSLPSGLQFDSSLVKFSTSASVYADATEYVGLNINVATVTSMAIVVPYDATRFRIYLGATVDDSGTSSSSTLNFIGNAYHSFVNPNWSLKGTFSVPIQGWKASDAVFIVDAGDKVENSYTLTAVINGATPTLVSTAHPITLTGTDTDWTLDYSSLGLTEMPDLSAKLILNSTQDLVITSASATSANLKVLNQSTNTNVNFSVVSANTPMSVEITRNGADYKAPKAFVGNVAKVNHLLGGVEYETGELIAGQKVFARRYMLPAASTTQTIATLSTGLKNVELRGSWKSGTQFYPFPYTAGGTATQQIYIDYDDSTGVFRNFISGISIVTGSWAEIRYTY